MKNPLTPAGIEPATLRFVAQHLNHCATAVPLDVCAVHFCIIYYLHQQLQNILTIYNTLSLRSSLNVSDQVKEDAIRNKK